MRHTHLAIRYNPIHFIFCFCDTPEILAQFQFCIYQYGEIKFPKTSLTNQFNLARQFEPETRPALIICCTAQPKLQAASSATKAKQTREVV